MQVLKKNERKKEKNGTWEGGQERKKDKVSWQTSTKLHTSMWTLKLLEENIAYVISYKL
jgi:hypothetical protein